MPKEASACDVNSEAHPGLQPFASESLCDCLSYFVDTKMVNLIDVVFDSHIIIVQNLFSQQYSRSLDVGQAGAPHLHFSSHIKL